MSVTVPHASSDCGFPNVRAAETEEETKALSTRLAGAEHIADVNGAKDVLAQLRKAARRSRAVRVRSLNEVYHLVKGVDQMMVPSTTSRARACFVRAILK